MTSRGEEVTEAEIDDFDVPSLADKDILDLQIAVHNAIPVAIIECTGNLTTELPGLFLLQFPMRDDIIKHLPAVHVFKEHVPVIISPHDVAEAADMWMLEKRDDSSFSRGPDLLRLISPLLIGSGVVSIFCRPSGDDFASNLKLSR